MHKITIYQKGAENVELFDDSNMNMDEYCTELSKLFQVNNITILKTTNSVFLVRPSKLTGIQVEEVKKIEEQQIEPASEKAEELIEDIITDID